MSSGAWPDQGQPPDKGVLTCVVLAGTFPAWTHPHTEMAGVGLDGVDPDDVYPTAQQRFEASLGRPPTGDPELGEWWLGYHHGRAERRRRAPHLG